MHKIEKLKTLGERSPGVEFMRSEVYSGDHGLAVIEHAPFGVIGAITPVTHSLPTITGNSVSMIAAGKKEALVGVEPTMADLQSEGSILLDFGYANRCCFSRSFLRGIKPRKLGKWLALGDYLGDTTWTKA